MVADGFEILRDILEDAFAVMVNRGQLAVHDAFGGNDLRAKSVADGLMAEADAEHGNASRRGMDQIKHAACVFRAARARGEQDAVRPHGHDGGDGCLAVAFHHHLRAKGAHQVDEIVSK